MKEKSRTNISVKRFNRKRIFDLLYREGNLTKMDIVRRLDMSLPTVTQDIRELLDLDLLSQSGYLPSSGGRKAMLLSCNAGARFSVGLDITRNHVSMIVLNLLGEKVFSQSIRLRFENTDCYFERIGAFVKDTLTAQQILFERVVGVGISVPAIVAGNMRSVSYATVVDFPEGNSDIFEKYIPFPCLLCNDSNAGGIAELWMNDTIKNAVYISVSDSVGGAFLIDHNIFLGENCRCGEIGHMTIAPNGRQCYCGKRGCVDAYCNTRILADSAQGTLYSFFDLLEQGSPTHQRVWEEYLHYLAIAVNNLHMLFDCNVIIGGYLGTYIERYMDQLLPLVADHNPFGRGVDKVQACRYKGGASAMGAALLPLKAFLENV